MSSEDDIDSSAFFETQTASGPSNVQESQIIDQSNLDDPADSNKKSSTTKSSESKPHSTPPPPNLLHTSAKNHPDSDDNVPRLEDLFETQKTLSDPRPSLAKGVFGTIEGRFDRQRALQTGEDLPNVGFEENAGGNTDESSKQPPPNVSSSHEGPGQWPSQRRKDSDAEQVPTSLGFLHWISKIPGRHRMPSFLVEVCLVAKIITDYDH
jgi:hypothetical protein